MTRTTFPLILLSLILATAGCAKNPQTNAANDSGTALQDIIIDQKSFDTLYATFNEEYMPEQRIPIQSLDQDAFKKLIQSGMNINVRNEKGQTLLMVATNPDVMKALIDAGIDVNAKDNNGWTALMNIAESTHCVEEDDEDTDCVDVLLASGANVNLVDNAGKSALMHTWELTKDCGPENYMDSRVYIKKLIKAGASVNEKDNDGKTPLMYAVYPESVQDLITAGADVNAKDKDGMTPLMYAEFPESVQLLINAGADTNAKDNDGMTPFMYAFARQFWPCHDRYNGTAQLIDLFKDAGSDINAKDNQGLSLTDHIDSVCSKVQSEKQCKSKCPGEFDACKSECGLPIDTTKNECISKCRKERRSCDVKCEQLQNRLDRIIAQYDTYYGTEICDDDVLPEVSNLLEQQTAADVLDNKAFTFTVITDFDRKIKDDSIKVDIMVNAAGKSKPKYDLDCDSDGTYEFTGLTKPTSCSFNSGKTHRISIRGSIPAIKLCEGSKNRVISINNWGDIQWESMSEFASGCHELIKIPANAPNLSRVKDMSQMFHNADKFNQPIGNWDVSNVTNMSEMFDTAESFDQPIGTWNVSNVKDMSRMFFRATSFNQPIGNWNVSKVTNMKQMFTAANTFNQPIGNWDVSNVRDMSFMFSSTETFNQPLENWNVSKVRYITGMFNSAKRFDQPLDKWDISNVAEMGYMFYDAIAFSHYPESWVIPEGEVDYYFGCADELKAGGYMMFTGSKVSDLAEQKPLKTHPIKLQKGESRSCGSD